MVIPFGRLRCTAQRACIDVRERTCRSTRTRPTHARTGRDGPTTHTTDSFLSHLTNTATSRNYRSVQRKRARGRWTDGRTDGRDSKNERNDRTDGRHRTNFFSTSYPSIHHFLTRFTCTPVCICVCLSCRLFLFLHLMTFFSVQHV